MPPRPRTPKISYPAIAGRGTGLRGVSLAGLVMRVGEVASMLCGERGAAMVSESVRLFRFAVGSSGRASARRSLIVSGVSLLTSYFLSHRDASKMVCLPRVYFVIVLLAKKEARDRKSTRLNSSHQIIS